MGQCAGLRVGVRVIAMVPVIRSTIQTEWWLGEVELFLLLAITVRLVIQHASVVVIHAHRTVAVIAAGQWGH